MEGVIGAGFAADRTRTVVSVGTGAGDSRERGALARQKTPIPRESIEEKILNMRGQRVMLDTDLAEIYGAATGRKATISRTSASAKTSGGQPAGPFFRFVRAAVAPVTSLEDLTDDALDLRRQRASVRVAEHEDVGAASASLRHHPLRRAREIVDPRRLGENWRRHQ